MDTKIISVGGSIIAPSDPDPAFLTNFIKMATEWLSGDEKRRLILVAGGGAPTRVYQKVYREVADTPNDEAADWIGVMATRLNAELLRACFGARLAPEPVVTNPLEAPENWQGRILVAAGWKPGFSSDNDAVLLAEKYGADTVLNLSNIAKVYTADPKKDENAKPLNRISWADFLKMVGTEWKPGLNAPFDPVASRKAAKLGLTVICAAGKDIENTRAILNGEPFIGTIISN